MEKLLNEIRLAVDIENTPSVQKLKDVLSANIAGMFQNDISVLITSMEKHGEELTVRFFEKRGFAGSAGVIVMPVDDVALSAEEFSKKYHKVADDIEMMYVMAYHDQDN